MKVAILGASKKPDRFAYKAFKMLQEYGHTPLPISPNLDEVEGVKTFANLQEVTEEVDTLTMYVGAKISTNLKDDILALKPRRVIFNPGSENPPLEAELKAAGIEVEDACTLVMLRSKQF